MVPPQCGILDHTSSTCHVDQMPICDSLQQHKRFAGGFYQLSELEQQEAQWQENTLISTACVARVVIISQGQQQKHRNLLCYSDPIPCPEEVSHYPCTSSWKFLPKCLNWASDALKSVGLLLGTLQAPLLEPQFQGSCPDE